MKFIVAGAGASGVTAAINLKRKYPDADVLVIEQLDKPLKKILATGNGKCNLGNANIDYNLFNNPSFVKRITKDYNYVDFFDSISIKTKLIGELAYPVSESAISVREALLNEMRLLKIKLNVNEKIIDYKIGKPNILITDKNKYEFDKLILSGGLKSSPKLGSDGSIIKILENHHYKISKLNPGLSPLYTKEKTKELDGIRCKANVSVFSESKLIHKEIGEVLFKDHGLSGIVIFNAMSYISRQATSNCKIVLDLLPEYSIEYLIDYLKKNDLKHLLLAFINPKISEYLINRYKNENDVVKAIKEMAFTFDRSYGYEFSQVTVGGVKVEQVNDNLSSKLEKDVYIIGELLDIDGPCGGYNLTWAFATGNKVKI